MNRRGFISMLAGVAGAPLVPWRGLAEPLIVLPTPSVLLAAPSLKLLEGLVNLCVCPNDFYTYHIELWPYTTTKAVWDETYKRFPFDKTLLLH